MAKREKSFSVKIDDEVSERFTNHVEERSYKKYKAIEGALKAFMAIPPEAQIQLMSNNQNAREILMIAFRDLDIEEHLQKLTPAQRSQILALAKEAAKTISRKK